MQSFVNSYSPDLSGVWRKKVYHFIAALNVKRDVWFFKAILFVLESVPISCSSIDVLPINDSFDERLNQWINHCIFWYASWESIPHNHERQGWVFDRDRSSWNRQQAMVMAMTRCWCFFFFGSSNSTPPSTFNDSSMRFQDSCNGAWEWHATTISTTNESSSLSSFNGGGSSS